MLHLIGRTKQFVPSIVNRIQVLRMSGWLGSEERELNDERDDTNDTDGCFPNIGLFVWRGVVITMSRKIPCVDVIHFLKFAASTNEISPHSFYSTSSYFSVPPFNLQSFLTPST